LTISERSAGNPPASTTRSRPAIDAANLPSGRRTIGSSILPVMSPPISSTSQP
jgi:hypothetical protein